MEGYFIKYKFDIDRVLKRSPKSDSYHWRTWWSTFELSKLLNDLGVTDVPVYINYERELDLEEEGYNPKNVSIAYRHVLHLEIEITAETATFLKLKNPNVRMYRKSSAAKFLRYTNKPNANIVRNKGVIDIKDHKWFVPEYEGSEYIFSA